MTTVLYDKRDRIAYVTIDRPDARNAIDPETHAALCAAWVDFRDDDAVDVAILTGAGDEAFCAGADLKTYIPPIIRGERASAPSCELGLGGLTRGLHRIRKPVDRGGQRLGARRRPGARARVRHSHRLRARALRLLRGAARLPPRRRRHRPARQHLRRGRRDARCCSPPSRSTPRALQWNLVSRVVAHDALLEEAELVARQILRNSQRAVRSRQGDDPRRRRAAARRPTAHRGVERLHGADPEETLGLLARFYDRSDVGRA